jgi:nucleotide-binding universal stress UspA family protein
VPVGVGQYYEDLKARGKEMLTAALHAAQRMNPQINVTLKVVEGRRVSDDIVTAATDGAFDLIVMSSRGLGGITGFLLGNVADRVADHSTCPVLIVK